jgi:hypothetical protein
VYSSYSNDPQTMGIIFGNRHWPLLLPADIIFLSLSLSSPLI